ncbi:hypothetical protein NOM68_16395 [Proteus mirabilis]|uniref:hypothetical protein n=1 Tax=Proteus mirabilis TaxID=584 RepID=UPI00214FF793|nr:hypothetical protein [Proteus mirabilis]MCS6723145.1 hypothetical protein [Proteus mirabilis]MCS6727789.1 hypothetical protein [Proteus mirabilis]MCS6751182.1 hypothetical protein [Proteus mirabilis]
MSDITYPQNKIHRHYKPLFSGVIPNLPLIKRFIGAINAHDWNRNTIIRNQRINDKQRLSVRSERRETWTELAKVMVAYANYSTEFDSICEVMCSVEDLARKCGQLHIYENGRKCYDPTLRAIRAWERAGLIYVDRDTDSESGQNKAQRIWLREGFFIGMGFSREELRKIFSSFNRWLIKTGKKETHKQRYARHLLELAKKNVASLNGKYKLKSLLLKTKRVFVGDDIELENEKNHIEKALKEKIELAKSVNKKDGHKRRAWKKYLSWKNSQPFAIVFNFEKEMKRLYPNINEEEKYSYYLKHLP